MIDVRRGVVMMFYIVIREHDVQIVQASCMADAIILANAHSGYDCEAKAVYLCDTAPRLIWDRDSND